MSQVPLSVSFRPGVEALTGMVYALSGEALVGLAPGGDRFCLDVRDVTGRAGKFLTAARITGYHTSRGQDRGGSQAQPGR